MTAVRAAMARRAAMAGRAALVAAMLLAASAAGAAEEEDIAPDRPSVGTGSGIVAPGLFQIESGLEYARQSGTGRFHAESLLRAGIASGLEARLLVEPVTVLTDGSTEAGFGDITLGLKYRYLAPGEDGWPPALAVMPFVKAPTARDPIGTERVDFGAVAIASFSLPWDLGCDVNAGVVAVGQRHGFLAQAVASLSLNRSITDRLSIYGELFFQSKDERGGRSAFGGDAGVLFLLTKRVALDAAVEVGLLGDGNDWAVRAGISVLLGHVRGH